MFRIASVAFLFDGFNLRLLSGIKSNKNHLNIDDMLLQQKLIHFQQGILQTAQPLLILTFYLDLQCQSILDAFSWFNLLKMRKMKRIISIALLLLLLGFARNGMAQNADSKNETVEIKTSAICDMCKERLEKNIAFEKGVKSVELNSETKVLTITYRKGKNSKEELKKAITKLGYDADDLPADQKAHDRLPACCQKGNEPH